MFETFDLVPSGKVLPRPLFRPEVKFGKSLDFSRHAVPAAVFPAGFPPLSGNGFRRFTVMPSSRSKGTAMVAI
jgi:hypothetical protein